MRSLSVQAHRLYDEHAGARFSSVLAAFRASDPKNGDATGHFEVIRTGRNTLSKEITTHSRLEIQWNSLQVIPISGQGMRNMPLVTSL